MAEENGTELTHEVYNEILALWLDRPSISHIVYQTGLSRKTVANVVDNGIPGLGLAPLPPPAKKRYKKKRKNPAKGDGLRGFKQETEQSDMSAAAHNMVAYEETQQHIAALKMKLAEAEARADDAEAQTEFLEHQAELDGVGQALSLAERRVKVEEKKVANIEQKAIAADNTRRSAGEAAIARVALHNCMNIGAAMSILTEKLLDAIANGDVKLPRELSPKYLGSLANSIDKLTSAMERAVKMEKGRAGEPQNIIGVQIGVLLDGCSDDEIDEVIKTGTLPERIRMTGKTNVIDVDN
jgi:protoporphyrinogen oxidase